MGDSKCPPARRVSTEIDLTLGISKRSLRVIRSLESAPRSRAGLMTRRVVPRYWSFQQARQFHELATNDQTYPVWAFLIGPGLRIGELVALRWPNVVLDGRVVHIVEFSTHLSHDVVPSSGKTRNAERRFDLDEDLANVLKLQRRIQSRERWRSRSNLDGDYVFTRGDGGPYHPQQLSRLLAATTGRLGLPQLPTHGLRRQ